MSDLRELRKKWEGGLVERLAFDNELRQDAVLVVLSKPGEDDKFQLRRYFTIANNWEVSVDGTDATLDQMFAWLKDPRAIPASEDVRLICTAANSHKNLLEAAKNFLRRLESLTTDEFSLGGEKREREALKVAVEKAEERRTK